MQNKLTDLKKNGVDAEHSSLKMSSFFDDIKIVAVTGRWFNGMSFSRQACTAERFSLEVILAGEVKLHLDRQVTTLKAPCFFWIGDHHRTFQFEYSPACEKYEHCWCDFYGPRGRRIYEWLCTFAANDSLSFPEEDLDIISSKFKKMIEQFNLDRKYYHSDIVVGLESVLSYIDHLHSKRSPRPDNDPYELGAVEKMFRAHPTDRFDIAGIARSKGISLMHFRALFREKFGHPVNDYILSLRMKYAADMLISDRMRVSEVADLCGFKDTSSFSRMFKRYYLRPPSRFAEERRKHEKTENGI